MLQYFPNFGATLILVCIPPLLLCTLQDGVIRGLKLQRYANTLRYPFTSTPGEHAEQPVPWAFSLQYPQEHTTGDSS